MIDSVTDPNKDVILQMYLVCQKIRSLVQCVHSGTIASIFGYGTRADTCIQLNIRYQSKYRLAIVPDRAIATLPRQTFNHIFMSPQATSSDGLNMLTNFKVYTNAKEMLLRLGWASDVHHAYAMVSGRESVVLDTPKVTS